MRLISQDGSLDFPYEKSALFINPRCMSEVRTVMIGYGRNGITIAKYSTKGKAIKAMKMLREVYEAELAKVFQFPQNEEIEV